MLTYLFQLNDIEKVSDRILTNLNGYQQLKDTLTVQKKTISNMITETYGNWVKDRRSAVINKSFRYSYLKIVNNIYHIYHIYINSLIIINVSIKTNSYIFNGKTYENCNVILIKI